MLEPQSTALFVLLIAMFGVLMWRTLAARRTTFRVLAACLAFVPAMTFGVLAVNKYYGYYQTWGSMVADLTQQSASAAAGVLSGYFVPFDNRLTASGAPVSPFGGSAARREQNTPLDELRALPATTAVPRFWLAAGTADGEAVADAETFRAGLLPRQPAVPLTLTSGGGHTMTTWRAELPSLLSWMTPRLARTQEVAGVPAATA